MNRKLTDALQNRNQGRPPIWLMRQAGRYMPEYRAMRKKYSFLEMCHQPELVAEITRLPLKAFGMDAAILFSDILVIPEALGVGLRFEENIGPIIERPVRTIEDIHQLPSPYIPEALKYVAEGINLLKPTLKVPLIGFSGAPFTVASYMIEGGASRDLRRTKQWMLKEPDAFHLLLNKIADSTIDYLNLQIESGVQALQIFDSWANVLAPAQFREFSLAYMDKLIKGLKNRETPVILFCKGSSGFLHDLASINPAAISVDWNVDIDHVRRQLKSKIALQGNLDPDILYGSNATIRREAGRILQSMEGDPGFIFNLGHGIHPDIPCDAVKTLVETVNSWKA